MLELKNLTKSYGKLVANDSPEKLIAMVDGKNLEDVYMYYFGERDY